MLPRPSCMQLLDEQWRHFAQETRWNRRLQIATAVTSSRAGMSQIEEFLRASHSDETKPPFLFQHLARFERPLMRQQSFLETCEENDGELEALHVVRRQQ